MKPGNQWHSVSPPRNPVFLHEVPRNAVLLRWSGYLFCVVGIVALVYCGYVLSEARLFQAYQSWRFEGALKSSKRNASSGELPSPPVVPAAPEATLTAVESRAIAAGSVLLGRMEISRIGFAAIIMEGVGNKTLRHAVGHIPGTALPGAQGNVGIAGHRDTFFRGLQNIRKEDEITLTTLHGSYRYRVDSTVVVEPRDVWVLRDTGDATLTLVTCYPFDYVGAAPQRFIVRARKIS